MEHKSNRQSANRTRNSQAARDAEARRKARKAAAKPVKRKPKKKRQTVRVKNRRFWKDLFIMLAITAAVILSMVIFFKVKTVDATGMEHYSAEQILQASGIEAGDNLLTLSKATVASRIQAELPYVREVQIKRELPNRVIIAVKEFDVSYAVKDAEGNNWLITATGSLLEQVDERTAAEHVSVTGFVLDQPVAGQQFSIQAAQENDTAATVQQQTVIQLLTLLEQSEVADHVVSVDVPASFDLSFWYGNQYHVLLGSAEELEYKLQYLAEVIKNLDSYASGEIDLSFTNEKKAIFRASQ